MPERRFNLTDEQILTALHMRDTEAKSYEQIARKVGSTRNAVLGLLRRIDKATDEHDLSPHLNGTMEPMWWKR